MRLVYLLFIFVSLGTQNGGSTAATAVTTPTKDASKLHCIHLLLFSCCHRESSVARTALMPSVNHLSNSYIMSTRDVSGLNHGAQRRVVI